MYIYIYTHTQTIYTHNFKYLADGQMQLEKSLSQTKHKWKIRID